MIVVLGVGARVVTLAVAKMKQCGDSIVGDLKDWKMIPPFPGLPTKGLVRRYVDSVVEEFVKY